MKITLLTINAKYIHSSLAMWYIAAGVEKYSAAHHEVNTVEATINQSISDIIARVTEQTPDLIGISTYIWNAGMLPELIASLRQQLPQATIVLGGPEASHNAEYRLSHNADYVIQGEGEHSFAALINKLDRLSGSETKPIEISEVSNDYINPYSDKYFDSLGGRIAYIETSRGCPFDCKFCLSGGSGAKFFPITHAKEQIRKLSASGTRTVKFVDRTFNCNAERAYALFEYVINLKTDCCFHFEIAADLLNKPTLSLLKTAPYGRIQFEIGLQSFHKPTLDAVSRKTDVEKAAENIKELLKAGNIHVHVDLIAGLPYETLPIFKDSFDRAYALNAHTLQLGFLKLLHGSKLREQADNYGIKYNSEPPYQIISNNWLSKEDLAVLKTTENALQHTYNKGRFLSALRYALNASALRPFAFFQGLGEFVSASSMPLKKYSEFVYNYCADLPNVNKNNLRDCFIRDSLAMTKGKSTPDFLKTRGEKRRTAVEFAKKQLGRVIDFDEAEVLSTGEYVYVDSKCRDSVTGLYRIIQDKN